ncbi:hypothetical protein ABPG75_010447 [Micractinium tetrahymenae]
MFSIDPSGPATLRWKLFATTTDPVESETPFVKTYPGLNQLRPAVCTTTLRVTGGQIAGVGDPDSTCPAATYPDDDAVCPKCPVGYACSGGRIYPCPFNAYNPLLGSSSPCKVCPPEGAYTSYKASQHCDVAKAPLAQECDQDQSASFQYDQAAQRCVRCPAGTWRNYADRSTLLCIHCPAGYYSASGDKTCTPCPIGQHSPVEGLADQSTITGFKCVACPTGSMALVAGVAGVAALPTVGNNVCSPCPPGTFLPAQDQACEVCPQDTFRTGDAVPENNVCKPVAPGYRLKQDGTHTSIELCPSGQVAFHDAAGKRVPYGQETECVACSRLDAELGLSGGGLQWAHTYAPRKGMSQCIPCPSGTIPLNIGQSTPGCAPCPNGRYRSANRVSSTCDVCGAGREVGPSEKSACASCRPGYFMTAARASLNTTDANSCLACPVHTYRPTFGASSCLRCPPGTQTANTGNIECTACLLGYYNNQQGQACVAAPEGTFVNTTGALVPTPCLAGSWNNELAQDSCMPCSPGRYSNTVGGKECKTCAVGTYSAGQDTKCLDCRPGYFSPAGAAACSPCKPGTFAPDPKSATCKLCRKGFQCPTAGMRTAGPCPKGTYANKEGTALCAPCPSEHLLPWWRHRSQPGGVLSCLKCPAGTDTRGRVGQSVCQMAQPAQRRLPS